MAAETTPVLESIGNYDLQAKIAEGGMGAVYRARHRTTGQIVAIKIVPPITAKNQTLLRRFEREFNAAHEIEHPNVVKAIEFCAAGPSPFLVMEFVDGETLGQRIDRDGKIPEEEAKRIIVQVCQGLHRAHKHNLIHRDIKPDNILLNKDGDAKITDLGLVKGLNEEELNLTRTGRGLGTPHFMAPEQFRDAKSAGYRCDVYSVGATLYMMVTGVMPFDGAGPLDCWMKKIRNDFVPPKELAPELSDRINWAILRSMSADPEKRPASCREFVEDLIGQSTRPTQNDGSSPATLDVWYLVYQDEVGETHTVKGTTDGIRRALKEHLLGDAANIKACRTKSGTFLVLERVPEFRDLIIEAAPMLAGKSGTAKSAVGGAQQPAKTTPPPGSLSGRSAPPLSNRMPPPSGRQASLSNRETPRSALDPRTLEAEGDTAPYVPVVEDPTAGGRLPHIPITLRNRDNLEWAMWIMLSILAAVMTVALYSQFLKR